MLSYVAIPEPTFLWSDGPLKGLTTEDTESTEGESVMKF